MRASIASIPPILQHIQAGLGISQPAAALLTTVPVLVMGALPLLVSPMLGQRPWTWGVHVALGLITLATALRYIEPSYAVLMGSTVLVGAGVAICQTLMPAAAAHAWPQRAAVLTAIYVSGMGAGAAVASALTAMMSAATGSWGVALAFWSAAPVLAAAALWATTPSVQAAPEYSAPAVKTPVAALARICAYFVGSAGLFWTLLAWIAPTYRDLGRSDEEAGLLMATFTLAQIPGSLLSGGMWNRWRFRTVDGLLAATTLALLSIPTLSYGAAAWIWSFLAGFGCGGLFSLGMFLPAWLGRDLPEIRRMSALSLTCGYLLASLGPLGFAVVRELSSSHFTPFACLAAVPLVMWLLSRSIERSSMRS